MSLPDFKPEGLPASLKIEGYPEVTFVLIRTDLLRPVYGAGVDDRGFRIYEQDELTTITLTVRNVQNILKGGKPKMERSDYHKHVDLLAAVLMTTNRFQNNPMFLDQVVELAMAIMDEVDRKVSAELERTGHELGVR